MTRRTHNTQTETTSAPTTPTLRKNGRVSSRDLPCLCGCGVQTHTRDARFLSGHDAILRRNLLRGDAMPEVVRPFFAAGERIAGLAFIFAEDGVIESMSDTKKGTTLAAFAEGRDA